MIPRREVLALLGFFAAACAGGRHAAAPALDRKIGLRSPPLVELVPAGGLVWLVESRPRELAATNAFAPAVAVLAPDLRVAAFSRRYGVGDLRSASEVVVAGFEGVTVGLASLETDLARVEAAFLARADAEEGRAVEDEVTRFWGTVGGIREQVAVMGQAAVGVERGRLGPLRAVIGFATGKLRRARPALNAEPLAAAAARIGPASLRAFAPGPFEGEWGQGLGGLLRAATAVAVAVRPAEGPQGVALTVMLTGGWGADATRAATRLGSSFRVLADDPLGKLTGMDRPLDGPRTTADAEALRLDVVWDATLLARGIKDATDASVAEIMGP
jgi:hypothetical protein